MPGTISQDCFIRFFTAADKTDNKSVCFYKVKGMEAFLRQISPKFPADTGKCIGGKFGYGCKTFQDQTGEPGIFIYSRF